MFLLSLDRGEVEACAGEVLFIYCGRETSFTVDSIRWRGQRAVAAGEERRGGDQPSECCTLPYGEMGNYFSASEKPLVHPVAQHHRRDLRVKARMTVKELRELVAQAESSGEDVGVLILSKSLLKGNFEVMDRPERDEDGIVREVMKEVDTIKED